jgi:hypothetical protein
MHSCINGYKQYKIYDLCTSLARIDLKVENDSSLFPLTIPFFSIQQTFDDKGKNEPY